MKFKEDRTIGKMPGPEVNMILKKLFHAGVIFTLLQQLEHTYIIVV